MKVTIRESAEDDLDRIFEWIAKDNRAPSLPSARGGEKEGAGGKIRDRINLLEIDSLAKMGRPSLVTGIRELIEYPHIIVYKSIAIDKKFSCLRSCTAREIVGT
jgi:hypothetical protein